MNLGKKSKSVIAIYAIILVVYIIGFLIIPFNKVAASWISFAFTIIAIAASLFVFNQAFNSKKTLVSKIYGFPIFRVGVVYALAQLVVGIVICATAAFIDVPYWIALLLSIIIFGAAAIGIIITDNARDIVEAIDTAVREDVKTVTYFQINIDGIIDECETPELNEQLEALREQLKFSDPVSSESTKEIEEKISNMLSNLKSSVETKNIDEASVLIKKICNATNERNRICKATKSNL